MPSHLEKGELYKKADAIETYKKVNKSWFVKSVSEF